MIKIADFTDNERSAVHTWIIHILSHSPMDSTTVYIIVDSEIIDYCCCMSINFV